MGETAIKYDNVVKIYERSHLGKVTRSTGLDGLALEIRKGEIFAVLGLNGAGKTTAMKLVLGLLNPTLGAISVAGFLAGTDEVKRRIGYLPELPYFYPYLTPAETLAFYGRLSGMDEKDIPPAIEKSLKLVGLDKHAGKKVREFSKGMMQRLGVAQAILHSPEILILDEPVSGLDPLAILDFRELFVSLNKAGTTIFLSSHSISEVEKISSRAAILVAGKLARVVDSAQWQNGAGGLESIFVETVRGQ